MSTSFRFEFPNHLQAFLPSRSVAVGRRSVLIHAQSPTTNDASSKTGNRRDIVLKSINVAVLGALLNWGAAPPPSTIGVRDYGGGVRTLSLCPPSPNCISTAEEINDPEHYVPGAA